MPQTVPRDTATHYERVQRYQRDALLTTLGAWREVDPGRISESWEPLIPYATVAVTSAQISASESALIAAGDTAVATGQYRIPDGFVDPASVAGETSVGGDLDRALYVPAIRAKQSIEAGTAPAMALRDVHSEFQKIVGSMIADAGRKAATAGNATRFTGGYVRMLNPPSCQDCTILAGRWYRWNTGFLRHPNCDCVHIGAQSAGWAQDEGFISDPYEYFHSLSTEEQDATFGAGGAQAIRDGGDVFQVVNSRRGRSSDSLTTTASTGRRGIYRGPGDRLTPDGIYERATSRTEAVRLLEQHGYVLPGGQDPAGVIRGQREGYGQMGRGGKRVGARHAVEQARRTGVRHPSSRATMTAAERRRFDAGASWDAVREGRNPYGRAPLTDFDRRKAEFSYEKYVLGFYGGDPALPTTR